MVKRIAGGGGELWGQDPMNSEKWAGAVGRSDARRMRPRALWRGRTRKVLTQMKEDARKTRRWFSAVHRLWTTRPISRRGLPKLSWRQSAGRSPCDSRCYASVVRRPTNRSGKYSPATTSFPPSCGQALAQFMCQCIHIDFSKNPTPGVLSTMTAQPIICPDRSFRLSLSACISVHLLTDDRTTDHMPRQIIQAVTICVHQRASSYICV
jgi:hypothetical protein